jgi:hypothetical protein
LDGNEVERSVLFAREIVERKLTMKGPLPAEIDREEVYASLDGEANGKEKKKPRES